MTVPQLTLSPCFGLGTVNLREFKTLLASILGLRAIAVNQRANFSQFLFEDAAFDSFETLQLAER